MTNIKKYLYLVLVFFTIQVFSQEYDRTWGSYYGPSGMVYPRFPLLIDNSNNLHFIASVNDASLLGNSYFNQFSTDGSTYTNQMPYYNFTIIPNGNLTSFGYKGEQNFETMNVSKDNAGNFYGIRIDSLANAATPGTWFPNAISNVADKWQLVKRNNTGAVLWKTYLPISDLYTLPKILNDDIGNVYIIGRTNVPIGITTPGVFQENFEVYNNDNNLVITKLNPNGQLLWSTYFPSKTIFDVKYFDHHIYILTGPDVNPAKQELATNGTFQSQKSETAITKLNSDNGTRVWGTYYGPTTYDEVGVPCNLVVDADGIFVSGYSFDMSSANSNYFGTPGSYQSSLSGESDVFLSKFNLAGQRIWSTYFGSPGEELMDNQNNYSLAKNGSNLYLTFIQNFSPLVNSTNLATQGAYIDSPPIAVGSNYYHNFMFAKFNNLGSLVWASYYGGSNLYNTMTLSLGISFANSNTFYLYGTTLATEGIATPGAFQSTNLPNNTTFFVARFDKKTEMSTTETDHLKDLVLYNNPNNGAFAFQGSVLQKKALQMVIYDGAGRLILQQKLNKDYKQSFDFSHQLKTGNYFLELKDNKQLLKSFKLIVK